MQGHSTPLLVATSTGDDSAISALPDVGVPTAAPAALGTVARFASVYGKRGELVSIAPRVRRFMLQSGARDLLPDERVAICLRRPIPGVASVDILYSLAQQAAHYGNLQVCGSVWMCPVCQAKLSERRREELSTGIAAYDGQIIMVTLTLQHSASDDLVGLLEALQEAKRMLLAGRAGQTFKVRHGVVGSVRALENTHTDRNGHHPHQHVLYFVSGTVDVERFKEEIQALWLAAVAKVGRYASPKWGIHVTASSADIAAYLAKWGKAPRWTAAHELAKAGSKHGRGESSSMLELLENYVVVGDEEAGARWREYALAFKGRKQLVYSKGLRKLLGLVEQEKTDEELVEESVEDAVILAQLDMIAWRVVLMNDARAELLDVANSGDVFQVHAFLSRLGVSCMGLSDSS